jgi:hypothetical protein
METATPQDTFNHTIGAGALSYGWWLNTRVTGEDSPDWTATITADDGNDGEVTVTIRHQTVLTAARAVLASRPEYASDALVRECGHLIFDAGETDFDAASSDELLQVMVLGKIIYG